MHTAVAQERLWIEPKRPRNGPERALGDPRNPPRRPLESLLAIMMDPKGLKKARWRPRALQEDPLEAKSPPRDRFKVILGTS